MTLRHLMIAASAVALMGAAPAAMAKSPNTSSDSASSSSSGPHTSSADMTYTFPVNDLMNDGAMDQHKNSDAKTEQGKMTSNKKLGPTVNEGSMKSKSGDKSDDKS